jgi:DNA-binding MarR family transcriptional regulator
VSRLYGYIMPKATPSLSTTLHLLHRATQLADAAFMRHLPPEANLTPRQLAVLEAVAANNGLSQTDIMAETGIDRSSIAELVKRLIKHGCLQRRRTSRDARLYAVKITPAGRRLIAIGAPAARAVDDDLLAPVSGSERQTFLTVLSRMAADASRK